MSVRVGVVGMGFMGELHARIYQSMPHVELIGLVEVDFRRKEQLESQFGVPVYTDLNELLTKVDAVSICTPDPYHKEPVLEAFRHRVKVLVEKPLSISYEQGLDILAARPDPTFLMVGHLLRFDARLIHCRDLLRKGSLGKLWYVKIWRNGSLRSGMRNGGRTSVSSFLGIHDIDVLLWLTGLQVKEVHAMGQNFNTKCLDFVHAQLQFDNGVFGTMENTWLNPLERSSDLDAGLKIVGERGMIEVDLSHSSVTVSLTDAGRQFNPDTHYYPMDETIPYGDLRREVEAFVGSVLRNEVPPITGEEGLEAVRIIEWIEGKIQT